MLAALFVLVIAIGAIAAGVGYVRAAHRMRGFKTTRGRITSREAARVVGFDRQEARWGSGGGYTPAFTYTYEVAGTTFTGDKLGYATEGLKKRIAEERVAAMPDEVDVYYNPADPSEAYLRTNSATFGWVLAVGGGVLALGAVIALVAA
jgi:hypothetical protein